MKFLYDVGIRLYGAGAFLAGLRSEKARMFRQGRRSALKELTRITAERAPEGYDFWFHAASLGEFEQARPVIEMIRAERPSAKILLTFFSPSGYNVRKNYEQVTAVAYLPADTKSNARKFLDITKPACAVFVKYEFWLNFLDQLERRKIPTFLISAIFRKSQSFFRPWGGVFRKRLGVYDKIYVQDENSSSLLDGVGVKSENVVVTGDTRFDRVYDIMKAGTRFPAIERWRPDRFTLVVGSSWPQDENRYIEWINSHPEIRVIIAPHEFDERRIEALRGRLKNKSVRWTDIDVEDPEALSDDIQTLVVNTFGKLSSLYRYADAVIVGGGFGAGIHNINEAAVYGVPVIFGPNNRKFKEAADLKSLGGGFEYNTDEEIVRLLEKLIKDEEFRKQAGEASANYIRSNLGATQIIARTLLNISVSEK